MFGHKDGVSLHKYKAMVTLIEHQGKSREPNGLWKIVPGCFLEMKKKCSKIVRWQRLQNSRNYSISPNNIFFKRSLSLQLDWLAQGSSASASPVL